MDAGACSYCFASSDFKTLVIGVIPLARRLGSVLDAWGVAIRLKTFQSGGNQLSFSSDSVEDI